MSFGVTAAGFVRKTLAQILDDLEAGWVDIFGASVDVSPSTPDGQILGIVAGELDEAWQAAEAAYLSYRPRQAVGAGLSDIVVFNGISRKIGTRTVVSVVLSATQPIVLPQGTQVKSDAGDLFEIITPGTYLNGNAALFRAIGDGPILVGPGEINTISTPVNGWTGVNNPTSQQSIGSLDESDSELRARQVVSTESAAVNILEALYAALLQVSGVSRVRIYVNPTAATVDGRPPHSYEVVVQGGTDQDVADAIWSRHPAGIELFGTTSQNITDSVGTVHAIEFTRPTAVPIFIEVTVSATSDFPVSGPDEIKQAIVDYAAGVLVAGEEFGIGDDVLVSRLYSATNSVQGHHVTALLVDDVDPPVAATDISITETQIAEFTIANIDVIS